MTSPSAEIGILGGSGFYDLLDDADQLEAETPFGPPSDAVAVGTFAGRSVAFLARHGAGHRLPPHRIDYRANLWSLHQRGITRLITPCAAGSLQPDIPPGTFVVLDQVVDRTWGRADTFFEGPGSRSGWSQVTHVSLADPYCPQLRAVAVDALRALDLPHRDGGTIVVVQGPRFASRAESRSYSAAGWHTIGMTQYPEVALARELTLCTLGIALVTDFDVGLADDPSVPPVSSAEVLEVFRSNLANLRRLLEHLVPAIPAERGCDCAGALDGAIIGG